MGRRNSGPRLRWLKKRQCFYICWTEDGRSRERSTGTKDREDAEAFLLEWLIKSQERSGPSDPSEVFVTDVLAAYAEDATHRAETGGVVALDRIGFAITPLAKFFEGQSASSLGAEACAMYKRWRNRAPGTVRRELGTLRASMNFAHRSGMLDRPVFVPIPPAVPAKDRWMTRSEVAALLTAARTGGGEAAASSSLYLACSIYWKAQGSGVVA